METFRQWRYNRDCDPSFTQQQETESQTEMEAIHIALLRNCSAAYLKLQMWQDAIDTCSQALELDCDDIKALSRRGQAYEQLGEVKPIIWVWEKLTASEHNAGTNR